MDGCPPEEELAVTWADLLKDSQPPGPGKDDAWRYGGFLHDQWGGEKRRRTAYRREFEARGGHLNGASSSILQQLATTSLGDLLISHSRPDDASPSMWRTPRPDRSALTQLNESDIDLIVASLLGLWLSSRRGANANSVGAARRGALGLADALRASRDQGLRDHEAAERRQLKEQRRRVQEERDRRKKEEQLQQIREARRRDEARQRDAASKELALKREEAAAARERTLADAARIRLTNAPSSIAARIEQVVADLNVQAQEVRDYLKSARTNFNLRAFSPFWQDIERALSCAHMAYLACESENSLRSQFAEASATLAAQPWYSDPVVDAPPATDAVRSDILEASRSLGQLIDQGQRDFEFAQIWELRRNTRSIQDGFHATVTSVSGLRDSVNQLNSSTQRVSGASVSIASALEQALRKL